MSRKAVFWLVVFWLVGLSGVFMARSSAPYVSRLRQDFEVPEVLEQASGQAETSFNIELKEFEKSQELSQDQTARSIGSFVPGQSLEVEWPVDVYTLELEIPVEDGSLSPISAEVYVPRREDGDRSEFPLIVYGAGTTGLNSRCAPSREDQRNPALGNYTNQMIAQASQGYIVALPNYEGLDTESRRRSYFNADLEARTMLATAHILTAESPAEELALVDESVFFGGYSQGGHAAFAAADKAGQYTPNLEIAGVFGHGGTVDITDFLQYNPNLAPYFVYAYREFHPNFPAERMMSARWFARLESAADLCVDEAFQFNSTNGAMMYNREFWVALRADDTDEDLRQRFPELYTLFTQNDAGQSYTGIPTLILQGLQDPIFTPESAERFVETLCSRKVPVSMMRYSGLDHFNTRQRSFKDTNAWIDAVITGEFEPNECGSL
jgi:pimeloyl-ACP methyl ester carboxylesterase